MNWTRMAIIGVLMLIILSVPIIINQEKKMESEVKNSKYNLIVDNSVKDAVNELVVPNNSGSIEDKGEGKKVNYSAMSLNLDKALERFYRTLYLNLNIENDYAAQQAVFENVPIKLVTSYDGYYINSWFDEYNKDKNKYVTKEKWVGKMKYEKIDTKNNLKVEFTLDDMVTVTNLKTKQTSTGDRKEFNKKYPNSYFGNEFENIRNQVVFECVQGSVEHFSHVSSNIAKKNGWKYSLKAPYVDSRLINNISFIAFLQGYGEQGEMKFNTYGFGVAKIARKDKVYGYTKNGNKYYKDEWSKDCNRVFQNSMDAASAGYNPDSY